MNTPKYTIAILDEEKKERDKFYNFFEDDFIVVEISAAESVDDLIEIIKSNKINAIAIDYNLKDHKSKFKENGDYFFKNLNSRIQNFPSFVLTQDSERAKKESTLINPFFIIDKEKINLPPGKEKTNFIGEIKNIIKTYDANISNSIKRLKTLEKKRKAKTLSDKEEQEYLELNNYLSKSISGYDSLPLKYFSQDTNKKLDEIISKTDELIKKISKKSK